MQTYKIIILVLLFFNGHLYAQKTVFNQAKMDSLFDVIAQYDKGMGSFAIWKDGKVVYNRAIGFADVAKQQKANKDTRYRIGSISKTFTAVLVMQLIEQGSLSLDTPLAKFFPQFPNADKITIKLMLLHRSGLVNFTDEADYLSYMTRDFSREELLKKILRKENDFKPDEKAAYSNTNYVLLSLIIEQLSRQDFAKVLQKNICQPLGLKDTYFGGKITPKNQEANSYQKYKAWRILPETSTSIPLGAGAIVSTPNDLANFFTRLFEGKLISTESLKQMKAIVEGYGFGLMQFPFYEKKAWGHTGGIDGFQSIAAYFPKEKVAIAYLSNGVDLPRNDILIGALSIYFGRKYPLPNFESIELSETQLEAYLGNYASTQMPLKIKVYREGKELFGQATGQAAFPLEAFKQHHFRFTAAGLEMVFDPKKQTMLLKQYGASYQFQKEKD